MRRLLLDTHALLWMLSGDASLGPAAREAIRDPENDVFVSAATMWEFAIMLANGRIRSPDNLRALVAEYGYTELPITFAHAEQAGALPLHHKDPFDRMLVAQAQMEGLTLVTADGIIPRYDVHTLPARR